MQGVLESMNVGEEEKAACTGEKILLKVMLKSLQNRKINYVKGGEVNDLKQNLSALTQTFDLSRYGATSRYSALNEEALRTIKFCSAQSLKKRI